MTGSCLTVLQASYSEWVEGLNIGVYLLDAIAFGIVVAGLSASSVLNGYSRAMMRFMRFRQVATPPAAWWQARARLFERPPRRRPDSSVETLADAMRLRRGRIRTATVAAYAVFILASVVLASRDRISAPSLAIALLLLAVAAAGPAIINVIPEVSQTLLLGVTSLVLVLLAVLAIRWGQDLIPGLVLFLWPFQALCLHRRLRALFVPLTVLVATGSLSLLVTTVVLLPFSCVPVASDSLGALAGLVANFALCLSLCLWLGTQLLSGLARIHELGYVSDLSMVAGAGLFIDAVAVALSLGSPVASAVSWLVLVASTIATYALVLRIRPRPALARSLLVLRVFSKDAKSEKLLDFIQNRWRFAGPVLQIGGPDLATLTIDPYELVKYVTFKAHELFLPGEGSREQIVASLDLEADREGRFRINEVFCFDTAWRSTVEKLMDLVDVILLDLRGFSATRGGTAFEISCLAERGHLGRVVVIGDDDTDWPLVDRLTGAETLTAHESELRMDASATALAPRCLEALAEIASRQTRPLEPGPAS